MKRPAPCDPHAHVQFEFRSRRRSKRQAVGWVVRGAAILLAASLLAIPSGCGINPGRAAISLSLKRPRSTPRDASVYIDEQYIGPLYYVAAKGVRLPVGQHRITVTRDGYFPWDRLVEADRKPVTLQVKLIRIPD